jgi:catechol 2,3-dioxygenase-like lactoylglutathione lyase family enzyme
MSQGSTFLIALTLFAGCSTPEMNMKNDSRPSALHPAEMVGFLVTCDVARCRSFYVDRLGFRQVGEDPFALVLEADGRMIRVQKAKTHEPRPYTVLGWNVSDIEAARDRLAAVGVNCEQFGLPGQDARGIMTFSDGARVAWFKDPDGNTLSIAQLP